VQGTVVDSVGNPVEGVLTSLRVFDADSAPYSPIPPPPFAVTDSAGLFALGPDSLNGPTIDSIQVRSMAPSCRDPSQVTVVPGAKVPAGGQLVVDIAITQAAVHPPARTAPGEYCANGIHPFWGPGSYVFALQIDSVIAGNVWGRWDLNYGFSSSDDQGTFVGGATAAFVVLNLTSDPVWHSCTTMQLYVPVRTNGTWEPATIVGEQACLPDPAPFSFVADTVLGLFR
jgi:hypothetical protein